MSGSDFISKTTSAVEGTASSVWNSKTSHIILMGLTIVFLICVVVALFMKSGTTHLRSSGEEHFLSGAPVQFKLFYAPWCGHCKNVKPHWDNMCDTWNRHKDVEFVQYNCDDSSGKAKCAEHSVRGYPTILLTVGDKDIEFNGARTRDGLVKFLEDHLTKNGYSLD